MPFVRRRGRRSYQFGETWDEAMAGLTAGDPDIWYTFEAASTEYPNDGTAPAIEVDAVDVFGTGANQFEQTGGLTSANSMARTEYRGYPRMTTGSGERIASLNSDNPSASGTFLILFRCPWDSNMGNISDYFVADGISTSACGLRCNPDRAGLASGGSSDVGMFFRVRKTTSNFYDRYWSSGTLGSSPADGDWHLFIATMDAGTFKMYWDGTEYAPDHTVTGGLGVAADWFDDLVGSGELVFGGVNWSSIAGMQGGEFDEFAYWDGTVMGSADVTRLWATVDGLTAGSKAGLIWEVHDVTGDGPNMIFNAYGDSNNFQSDYGMGRGDYPTTPTGVLEGTPISNPTGRTDGPWNMSCFENVATGNTAGEGTQMARIAGGSYSTDTSGIAICHFQNTTDNAWSQHMWVMSADSDDVYTDDGSIYLRVQTDGTVQFRVYDDAGGSMLYSWDYTNEGVDDPVDGSWHQIIVEQKADGNGIILWYDGREIAYNNSDVTQDATNKDFWMADADPEWGLNEALSRIGLAHFPAATGTGQFSFEGYHGTFMIDEFTGLTSTTAGRISTAGTSSA